MTTHQDDLLLILDEIQKALVEKELVCTVEKLLKYRFDHLLFWIATIGFHIYTRLPQLPAEGAVLFATEIILRNSFLALTIYLNLLFIAPLLLKKKYFLFSLLFLSDLILYTLLKDGLDIYRFNLLPSGQIAFDFWNASFYNFSIGFFYIAFSIGLELSKSWFFQREQLQKIELEKVNTELAYLKSQINPHFLFNSLNTIFFQIDKTNLEARNTLSQFSEMLRFQLYECNASFISLEKEINYLKNYVDLQRLRKDENYQIDFSVTGELKNTSIAPLLLIPFVENAFKHISNFTNQPNEINIRIQRNENELTFYIQNTKETKLNSSTNGIGLKNAKRRLELQYPSAHQLVINEREKVFEVNLKINLS